VKNTVNKETVFINLLSKEHVVRKIWKLVLSFS